LPVKDAACLTLSGADGSGKTTTAKFLKAYFGSCVHWFRGTHIFASILSRFLSHFNAFKGDCNPYYGICVPDKLRFLWIHLEFWSLLPHLFTRFLLKKFCRFLICDRGILDFIVWIVVTLNKPSFLQSIYGSFLLRLVFRERPIYLYADADTLAKRADMPREFVLKELAVYSILAKHLSLCSIDTGGQKPLKVIRGVLKCLERR